MKARVLLLVVLFAGTVAEEGPLRAQSTEMVDTIFMNDAAGTRRVGHIVGIDANAFKVEVTLAVGGAKATVAVPRAQVSRVEFAPSASRDRLIANPTAANATALGAEWLRWQPFLAVSKSPAAAVGNAYAAALLASSDPKQAPGALRPSKPSSKMPGATADRAAAKQGRLRALVATGHAADAVAEATALAKESEIQAC